METAGIAKKLKCSTLKETVERLRQLDLTMPVLHAINRYCKLGLSDNQIDDLRTDKSNINVTTRSQSKRPLVPTPNTRVISKSIKDTEKIITQDQKVRSRLVELRDWFNNLTEMPPPKSEKEANNQLRVLVLLYSKFVLNPGAIFNQRIVIMHYGIEGKDLKASFENNQMILTLSRDCLLYTSPSPRDGLLSRMPSSA